MMRLCPTGNISMDFVEPTFNVDGSFRTLNQLSLPPSKKSRRAPPPKKVPKHC